MKKNLCFIALAFLSNIVIGQTLDDLRKLVILGKNADAKKIQSFMQTNNDWLNDND